MIKIKMSELLNSIELLQKLAGQELKARSAWQVAKLLKSADTELNDFNETRINLVKKYGEKDENNELIKDDKENCKIMESYIEDFSKELNELIESEVEVNANKLKLSDLENINFTPAEMTILEPFIDMEE